MAPPTSLPRKRPAATVKIEAGASPKQVAGGSSTALLSRKKLKPSPAPSSSSAAAAVSGLSDQELEDQFLALFQDPAHAVKGVSNSYLKSHFGQEDYIRLAPIINALSSASRLNMSRGASTAATVGGGGTKAELYYTLVSSEMASKFAGLDVSARLVYQVIEKAGNMGIWTKDIKKETNIQNQALTKIFKTLENRRLVKPVKSIAAKAKKLYMVYELTPSTELTGGIWYSDDLEFDFGFINELRNFLRTCVRKLNQGRGVTLQQVLEKLQQAQISRVHLGLKEVGQVMQTLVYDQEVDTIFPDEDDDELLNQSTGGTTKTALYIPSRRVGTMCEFKMWGDVLASDFHFRTIRFEDGVTLKPHEPHYQS